MAERLRFTKIDELKRRDHHYLGAEDDCYHLREYTPRGGYVHSYTNDVVSNLKKSLDKRGLPEWQWKEKAIATVAAEFRHALGNWARRATLVPIPPSYVKSSPLHDDRMLRIVQGIDGGRGLDVRELLVQTKDTVPDHLSEPLGRRRLRPEEREQVLAIDESCAVPPPSTVALFDDVLTNGSHFVAAKRALVRRFSTVRVVGFFFARREIIGDTDAD